MPGIHTHASCMMIVHRDGRIEDGRVTQDMSTTSNVQMKPARTVYLVNLKLI